MDFVEALGNAVEFGRDLRDDVRSNGLCVVGDIERFLQAVDDFRVHRAAEPSRLALQSAAQALGDSRHDRTQFQVVLLCHVDPARWELGRTQWHEIDSFTSETLFLDIRHASNHIVAIVKR